MKFFPLSLLLAAVVFGFTSCRDTKPQELDLSGHYRERFDDPKSAHPDFYGIAGHRMFDGVPFAVDGRAVLYGREVARDSGMTRADFPDFIGIKVGRAFDELHLLHTTQWSDVEGMTVARVRLNYTDGTKRELNLGYGVHVRDWQRLRSEPHEAVTDPNTKVIWRGPGIDKFKSSQRMFKSILMNPLPGKQVETIDFVSTEQIASYDLYAATVINSDRARPVTPSVPLEWPERNFDGQISVRVLDSQDRPIEGAWVNSALGVPGRGWATATTPLYSSAAGTGVVKYPTDQTDVIIFNVSKDGWRSTSRQVNLTGDEKLDPETVITFHLTPDSAPAETH